MNRFRFKKDQFEAAKKFIKTKKGSPPNWAKREDLSVKGNKIFWKTLEIIPEENVDALLRKTIYSKEADTPASRDAAFHLIKQKYLGISRARIMKWLRAQRTLGETRAAVAQPKRKAGPKLGRPTFEFDLVFVKKRDCIESGGKRFDKASIKEESYICSCVEKTSGLCSLDWVQTKEQSVVTPIVIKQIRHLCRRLNLDPAKCSARSDKGGEFGMAQIQAVVPDYKYVSSGVSIEKKNQQLQQAFFRLIKARQALTIRSAVKKSEKICNQTVSKYHKKTPNEMVEEKTDMKEVLKKYNSTRKSYIPGDRRNLAKDDYVRILIKDKKAGGVGFKSYKNKSYTERVFIIKKVTKKAVPPKFYVNGRWYTKDLLLKSAPRDKQSDDMIAERERAQKEEDDRVAAEEDKKREAERVKNEARKKKLRDEGQIMKVRKGQAEKVRKKIAAREQKSKHAGERIEEAEKEYQDEKKVGKKKRVTTRTEFNALKKRFNQIIAFVEGEEDKTYVGKKNEKQLEKIYNQNIREGQALAKKLRAFPQSRRKVGRIKYFDDFVF